MKCLFSSYEQAVMCALALGATPAAIARSLERRRVAIYGVLTRLRRKLGIQTNTQLAAATRPARALNPLSALECSILERVAGNLSARQIAYDLGVTRSNVKSRPAARRLHGVDHGELTGVGIPIEASLMILDQAGDS